MDDFQADIEAVGRIGVVPMILDVVCRSTGMGFAAIARVTEDRWIACSVKDDIGFGLKPGGELPVATTICNDIRNGTYNGRDGVIFDNADEDPVFCTHHTPAMYGLKSYISLPIRLHDGTFFGTLCAIDPKPHKVNTPETIGMFRLFADLIAFHLHALEKADAADALLAEERRVSELREQFIAVLGHDLRNPLGAITVGADMLGKSDLPPRGAQIVGVIQKSALRMSELIGNVVDFARSRMGAGLSIDRQMQGSVDPMLHQVIAELSLAWPDRAIATDFRLNSAVQCDRYRMAQLFSNLLGNALTYGDPSRPVQVHASSGDGVFTLSVANAGAPIAPAVMARLFQPFSRGEVHGDQQGLGLGLYIASQIARAHGGTLTASSDAHETRFRLTMPTGLEA